MEPWGRCCNLSSRRGRFSGLPFPGPRKDLQSCNDVLSLTRPEIVAEVHGAYLSAGADIIETNTFNAQAVSLADYGLETQAYEINRSAAEIAVRAARAAAMKTPDKPRLVAGAIGPTNRTASLSPTSRTPRSVPSTSGSWSRRTASRRGSARRRRGPPAPETTFDTLNLKAALYAIQDLFDAAPGASRSSRR
jgi:5-methyltetrahydrofolate--homocysteine methyltransferase